MMENKNEKYEDYKLSCETVINTIKEQINTTIWLYQQSLLLTKVKNYPNINEAEETVEKSKIQLSNMMAILSLVKTVANTDAIKNKFDTFFELSKQETDKVLEHAKQELEEALKKESEGNKVS